MERLADGSGVLLRALAVTFAGAHLADLAERPRELRPRALTLARNHALEGGNCLGGERFQHLRTGGGILHGSGDLLRPGMRIFAFKI
jgi:hypothetical protein